TRPADRDESAGLPEQYSGSWGLLSLPLQKGAYRRRDELDRLATVNTDLTQIGKNAWELNVQVNVQVRKLGEQRLHHQGVRGTTDWGEELEPRPKLILSASEFRELVF